jgi:hypothetical protein
MVEGVPVAEVVVNTSRVSDAPIPGAPKAPPVSDSPAGMPDEAPANSRFVSAIDRTAGHPATNASPAVMINAAMVHGRNVTRWLGCRSSGITGRR